VHYLFEFLFIFPCIRTSVVSTLTLGADIIVIIIIIIISGYGINWNEIYYYFLALFCHVLSPILVAFSELNTFCDFEIVKFDEGRCTPELCCGSVSPLISLLILLFVNHLARCCLACLTRNSILHPTHKSTLFHSIVKLPDDHRSAFVCIVTVATI